MLTNVMKLTLYVAMLFHLIQNIIMEKVKKLIYQKLQHLLTL